MFRHLLLGLSFFALLCLASSISHQSLSLAAIGALSLVVAVLAAALHAERAE